MKRILSILLMMILLTGTAAFADHHFEAAGTFIGEAESTDVSLDLYEQDDQLVATSSLFPEYAVVIHADQKCSLSIINTLLLLSADQVADLLNFADSIFMQFLDQAITATEYGVYAGDLFPRAGMRQTAEFPLSTLNDFFQEQSEKPDSSEAQADNSVSVLKTIASLINDSLKERNPVLAVQSFDQGCYLSCRIVEQDHVIMTISVNRSDKDSKLYLVSYRDDSLYCFRELTVKKEQNHLVIRSSFRTASSPAYQNAAEKEALFTEDTILSDGADEPLSIQYILGSSSLSEPLYLSGTATRQDETASLTADVRINGPEKDAFLTLSMILEPQNRPVSFSDKTTVDMTDEKENAVIQLTAASNAAVLAAGIMSALPDDYQNMLLKLIYP